MKPWDCEQPPSQPSLRATILRRGLFADSLKDLWEGLTMALLMRELVANSEQTHEHGEKLEEDRERADEPTTAKTTGTVCFAQ